VARARLLTPTPAAAPAPGVGLEETILQVLANPRKFPPEFSRWVLSLIQNNPTLRIAAFQLPNPDVKHFVGSSADAPFLNGWVNFGSPWAPASYFKDLSGIVHLQGQVKGGTVGSAIFTFPPAYQPQYAHHFECDSNGSASSLTITAGGDVVPDASGGGSNIWFSLSGISFRI